MLEKPCQHTGGWVGLFSTHTQEMGPKRRAGCRLPAAQSPSTVPAAACRPDQAHLEWPASLSKPTRGPGGAPHHRMRWRRLGSAQVLHPVHSRGEPCPQAGPVLAGEPCSHTGSHRFVPLPDRSRCVVFCLGSMSNRL